MGSKDVTIGYKYFFGAHEVLCQGPINAIDRIEAGNRLVSDTTYTSSQQIYINKSELFGGEENEGGIQGYVDLMFGEPGQGINSYLQSKAGALVSAYRGVVSIVKRNLYQTALNPYPKPWQYKLRRQTITSSGATIWNSTDAAVGAGMNATHILYELINNPEYGLRYATSRINETNFGTVADTLKAENFGLSLKWSGTTKILSMIKNVLRHINGVLRVPGDTGQFEIKLIRDDYTPSALKIFDESNIKQLLKFEVTSPGETVNKVTIKYTDLNNYGKKTSITVHNNARVSAENALVGEELTYEGITDESVARTVAFRDLRILSTPLAKLEIIVNRYAWDLYEGDVFKFSWAAYQIDEMIFRVTSVKKGTLNNQGIKITAVQDVFSIPATTYLAPQGSQWTSPNTEPAPLTYYNVFTAGYWELAQILQSNTLSAMDETSAYVGALGADGVQDMYQIEMYTSATGSVDSFTNTGSADNGAVALLDGAIGITDTSISVDNTINVATALVSNVSYCMVDNEMMRVDGVTILTSTTATITVSRGVGDTIPATHADNALMLFSGINAEYLGIENTIERLDGENVYIALLPRTTLGTLWPPETYDALETLTDRQHLPAPPAALYSGTQGATSYYGGTYTLSSTVEWTWAGRNRLVDVGSLIPHTTTSSTAEETNHNYKYEIRNQVATLRDFGTLAAPTRSITYDNTVNLDTSLEITLWSERDGFDSWQTIVHTMTSV